MKLRCLLVDDEPIALKILERYAGMCPGLEITGKCHSALEVLEVLDQKQVDLLFLDINMPELSGIELARSLKQPPYVIFTTAYPEYAVEGFEVEAIDYLVKPFAFERFLKAVQKVKSLLEQDLNTPQTILVKADKKLHKIPLEDIHYCEAYGDYVKVHLRDGEMLLTKMKLSDLEQVLPGAAFVRTHRSYIVASGAIRYLEGNMIRIGDQMIPVSQSNKENVLNQMQSSTPPKAS